MKLKITGARVIDPASKLDRVADIYVTDSRIAALGNAPDGFAPDSQMNAHGLIAIPGIVDLAAHLREPGQEHKATIASETRAAAASGITTLCCSPETTPCVDTPAEVRLIQQRSEAAGYCRVLCLGALTAGLRGEDLSEMAALKQAGCVGVTNGFYPLANSLVLRRAMEYAASHGLILFLHPLDAALANRGCVHEGAVAARLGLAGIPTAAETAALAQQLALVEQIGVRTHFCRLSSARSVDMLARAQAEGLPVSADVCAHQLFLTESDIDGFNSLCHTMPPLRMPADRDALRSALKDGIVAALCSHHQPHEEDAKQAPLPSTEPGISALETLLPLTLKLVEEGALTLVQAVERLTLGPARVLGIRAGTLSPGVNADICLIDPQRRWVLSSEALLSRGKNTPFAGWSFTGQVACTLLDGRTVFQSPHPPEQEQTRLRA